MTRRGEKLFLTICVGLAVSVVALVGVQGIRTSTSSPAGLIKQAEQITTEMLAEDVCSGKIENSNVPGSVLSSAERGLNFGLMVEGGDSIVWCPGHEHIEQQLAEQPDGASEITTTAPTIQP